MAKKSKKITSDKVYHALGRKYPRLILAVANEVHGTSYTGEEKVTFGSDEHYQKEQKGGIKKRVTDTHVVVDVGEAEEQERLHFECQSRDDARMPARMAEYDLMIALENQLIEGNVCDMELPRAAVIYLSDTRNTPKELIVHISAPDGRLLYKIPTLKIVNYTMETLLEKGLYLLIPFHILVCKNRFLGYNKNEEELRKLQKIYEDMAEHLERLVREGKLTQDELGDILSVSAEMIDIVAKKHERVRKALVDILRGQVYELPSDRLIRQGLTQGRREGRREGAQDMCIGLLKDGVISLAEASRRLNMTEEELKAKM